MGIGTITHDARSVAANLRSWTGQVADVARLHGPPLGALPFRRASSEDAGLATVDEALVRTVGWEMRDAVDWIPDGYCVQRSDLTVLSAAQRMHRGDLAAAYGNLAGREGRVGAQLVAYAPGRPGLGYQARFHSAALFRTEHDDLVVDHLVASSPDGVMTAGEWLRAVRPRTAADVAYVAATNRPPNSSVPSSRLALNAPWMRPEDWRATGSQLARALERGSVA